MNLLRHPLILVGLLLGLLLSACGDTANSLLDAQAVSARLNDIQSLQVTTPGLTDRFIAHQGASAITEVVTGSSAAALKQSATWKVVPGLADAACYSIEASDAAGSYLRHRNSRVYLESGSGALFENDATWCPQDGLSGAGISLESKNFPGRYLRHFQGQLWMAQKGGPLASDNAASFENDVSFNIFDPWSTDAPTDPAPPTDPNPTPPTDPDPAPPTDPNPAPPTEPGGPILPPAPGERLNMRVLNETNGAYPDDQVYWAILGYDPATSALSYLNAQGNLVPASPADNGALTKNGKGYSNYFNRVSDVGSFTIPKMFGARIFLSVGSPMFIEILGVPGGVGFAGPDINNPADPNQDVYFDFGEFTYNDIGYFGNNTRVDQFGFPVRMRLVGDGGAYDETIGENVSRDQIFNDFANIPQTEFRPLVKPPYRIVAPKAGGFGTGGSQTNYFDSYIDQIWSTYTNQDLVLTNDAGVFTGRVQGDNFVFSQEGGPSGLTIGRPNSVMVFEANGVFDTGSSLEKVIGAQLAAAINRHVVIDVDPSNWADDSLYYRQGPANFYANFWHERSINGKAYGFAYDDVFSKATLLQNQNPVQVDFIVGW